MKTKKEIIERFNSLVDKINEHYNNIKLHPPEDIRDEHPYLIMLAENEVEILKWVLGDE